MVGVPGPSSPICILSNSLLNSCLRPTRHPPALQPTRLAHQSSGGDAARDTPHTQWERPATVRDSSAPGWRPSCQ